VIIAITFGAELVSSMFGLSATEHPDFTMGVLLASTAATGLLLFLPCRAVFSQVCTAIDFVISGELFIALFKKLQLGSRYFANKIFGPESMPHMVALFIYVTSFGFLMGTINPGGFNLPAMPIALPVGMDQLLAYNGLGLVMLAFSGVG